MINRIDRRFKELKKNKQKAFIVFITAGYPSLDITKKLIFEFSKIGVDIIELGVPFSDPLADGPIIQESSQAALKRNVHLIDILNLVKEVRKNIKTPICLMTYYNPIFCFGDEQFIKKARDSGVDGVIIPDLPPEEAKLFLRRANKFNLRTIFFLSPTSSLGRIKSISALAKGFIYYVSLTGVTGPRKHLPPDLISNLRLIKRYAKKPVCVGFGVSNSSQVKQIYKIADGVIIGSAIIKKIKDNLNQGDLIKKVSAFVSNLKG